MISCKKSSTFINSKVLIFNIWFLILDVDCNIFYYLLILNLFIINLLAAGHSSGSSQVYYPVSSTNFPKSTSFACNYQELPARKKRIVLAVNVKDRTVPLRLPATENDDCNFLPSFMRLQLLAATFFSPFCLSSRLLSLSKHCLLSSLFRNNRILLPDFHYILFKQVLLQQGFVKNPSHAIFAEPMTINPVSL